MNPGKEGPPADVVRQGVFGAFGQNAYSRSAGDLPR